MAKCNFCKKSVKWIEVSTPTGPKWLAVDPKSHPRVKHECATIRERKEKPVVQKRIEDPWWND